jgi:hypothetical protein
MRIAYCGSELAQCGHCTLCSEHATKDGKLAFLLPVAGSQSDERARVDWHSNVVAAVCKK